MKYRATCVTAVAASLAAIVGSKGVSYCEKDGPYWDPEPLERAAKVFREINERPFAKQVLLRIEQNCQLW